MLKFDSFVRIYVCTHHERGLQRWLKVFGLLLKSFSAYEGVGGWVGEQRVETEGQLVLERWNPSHLELHNLIRLGRRYQAAETQEAVSVVWQTPVSGWQARVVFDQADWEELERELHLAFQVQAAA